MYMISFLLTAVFNICLMKFLSFNTQPVRLSEPAVATGQTSHCFVAVDKTCRASVWNSTEIPLCITKFSGRESK